MNYLKLFDEILKDWDIVTPTAIPSRNFRLVDTDEYDIIPNNKYLERQIKETEQALQELKDQKDRQDRWYEERIKSVSLKLDQLKQKLPTK